MKVDNQRPPELFIPQNILRPLRVERRLFLASKVVIFGVNSTGPHILGVKEQITLWNHPDIVPIPFGGKIESTLQELHLDTGGYQCQKQLLNI